MDRLEKFKGLSLKSADASTDIALINRYAIKELKPEDVFCFSVVLCDNDIDRDLERFTEKSLRNLATLFVGKTGISDHRRSADRQVARVYSAEVRAAKEKNSLGEQLIQLVAKAYMIRNESTKPLIEAIEGGIVKEVSVGCKVKACNCSICGNALKFDWRTWTYQCETGHIKGEVYDGKTCFGELEDAEEAYEFSFVAVPAQKGAGVTKSAVDIDAAFESLMEADLSKHAEKCEQLMKRMQAAMADRTEMVARQKILAENEQYINKSKGE